MYIYIYVNLYIYIYILARTQHSIIHVPTAIFLNIWCTFEVGLLPKLSQGQSQRQRRKPKPLVSKSKVRKPWMMSNLKWVQNSVEPLKIFRIFALPNCFQLSVLLEVQRWRRILPSSTIWSWKCQRMSWGPALRITRKSLKIQSWSCTIAISLRDNFCHTYVRFVGPFLQHLRLKKITTMANCLDLKAELESEARWRNLFSFDLLVMCFLHDALQVNAMRLVKAQAKAVLNEIKRQGQQSWGLRSWAIQSCVRKGSRGLARCALFEVPLDDISEFKPVKLTKNTFAW